MKYRITVILSIFLLAASITAGAQQDATEVARAAIIAALPAGSSAATATAEDISRAAIDVVFSMDGELEPRVTLVTVALGELHRSGIFTAAPRAGLDSPTMHFYNSMINLASASGRGMTPQYIIRVAQAMAVGFDVLNGVSDHL